MFPAVLSSQSVPMCCFGVGFSADTAVCGARQCGATPGTWSRANAPTPGSRPGAPWCRGVAALSGRFPRRCCS